MQSSDFQQKLGAKGGAEHGFEQLVWLLFGARCGAGRNAGHPGGGSEQFRDDLDRFCDDLG